LHRLAERLKIENDIVEIEGEPLFCLVPDDIGDLFGIHRRQREKAGDRILSRHGNRNPVMFRCIAAQKCLERFREYLRRVSAGLREHFRMLNEIACQCFNFSRLFRETTPQRLERCVPNINSPNNLIFCHDTHTPSQTTLPGIISYFRQNASKRRKYQLHNYFNTASAAFFFPHDNLLVDAFFQFGDVRDNPHKQIAFG
jgi:hypothetical protein